MRAVATAGCCVREGLRKISAAATVATTHGDLAPGVLLLGHADIRSTNAYLHADITIKERALARTTPAGAKPGRYRPPDPLLAFLESL
jgi:hypothetical protein